MRTPHSSISPLSDPHYFDPSTLNKKQTEKFFGRPAYNVSEQEIKNFKENKIFRKSSFSDMANITNEVLEEFEKKQKKGKFLSRFVIRHDNKYMNVWDAFILFLTAYSCIVTAYDVGFDPESTMTFEILQYVCEALFFVDIILRFFHAYKDSKTHEIVDDFRSISINYLK